MMALGHGGGAVGGCGDGLVMSHAPERGLDVRGSALAATIAPRRRREGAGGVAGVGAEGAYTPARGPSLSLPEETFA